MSQRNRSGSVARPVSDQNLPPPPPPPSTQPPPTAPPADLPPPPPPTSSPEAGTGAPPPPPPSTAQPGPGAASADASAADDAPRGPAAVPASGVREGDKGKVGQMGEDLEEDEEKVEPMDAKTKAEIDALLSDASSAAGVAMEGWLTKEGRVRKSWKRRWFVLRGTHLSYFTDHMSTKPKGDLGLDSAKVQPCTTRKDVAHCIEVLAEGRKLLFQADTAEVAAAWVLELNRKVSSLDYVKKVRMMRGEHDMRVMRFFTERGAVRLNLSGRPLALEAVVAMDLPIRYHNTLVSINVRGARITDIEMQVLSGALADNTTVKTLNASENEITSDGAVALASAMERGTVLEELILDGNKIADDGAEAVARAIVSRGSLLRRVSVARNEIGCRGASAIASKLADGSTTSVRRFEFSGNSIADVGAAEIAAALRSNAGVTALELSNNNIEDAGASSLAAAIASAGQLGSVLLAGNNIGPAGTVAIADAVSSNRAVKHLDFGGNRTGQEGLTALANAGFVFQELEIAPGH